ncbi:MAG: phage terminase large subunit [Candidatus Sumerlaeaceae bacterium]|nr:phage terminase large subunit [Candidatus Sumerlaeaceae bacterium]
MVSDVREATDTIPLPAGGSAAFARRYFPHLCRRPFCALHLDSFARYDALASGPILTRTGTRFALAAPRGAAKSTIHSLILPLLDLCLGRERHIVLISATLAQARTRLRNLRLELERNDALRADHPRLTETEKPWNRHSLSAAGALIEVFGAGAEIRGIGHAGFRPTKIILDDAEDSRRVATGRARRATADWYSEVIENLGDTYTHIEVIGTILHPQSLLATLLARADFTGRLYRSVESWADRADLWAEWRLRLMDPLDPDRLATAHAFFEHHRGEMLRGARVLWPEREDYEALMIQCALRGRRAFFKEKQNAPFDDETRLFRTAEWRTFVLRDGYLWPWVEAGRETAEADAAPRPLAALRDLQIFGFLDPAMCETSRSDYAAIATVGRDAAGLLYVLDLWMTRATPEAQVRRAFDLHEAWNYALFGVETNQAQQLFAAEFERERQARRAAGRPWQLPLHCVKQTAPKRARIARLEHPAGAGWLLFSRELPEEFRQQADEYPGGLHDDGLDALAEAVRLASDTAPAPQPIRPIRRIPPCKGLTGY